MNFFELTSPVILLAEGRDAQRYINNRLSNDIKSLTPGDEMRFAAALSVQGKTEGFFAVCRRSAESFLLICDGGEASEIVSAFSRYKVADRFNITDLTQHSKGFHIWPVESNQALKELILGLKNEFGADLAAFERNRFGVKGADLFLLSALMEIKSRITQSGFTEVNPQQADLLRMQSAIPSFPSEICADYLLQESGLAGCISTSKGCYVGQEVTQKIRSFAQLPFQLSAFTANRTLTPGSSIFADTNSSFKVGEIVSSAWEAETTGCFGFARLKTAYLQDLSVPIAYASSQELQLRPIYDFSAEPCRCF